MLSHLTNWMQAILSEKTEKPPPEYINLKVEGSTLLPVPNTEHPTLCDKNWTGGNFSSPNDAYTPFQGCNTLVI